MPSRVAPELSEDEVDDILYFSRSGNLRELNTAFETLSKQYQSTVLEILVAAVDQNSANTALHMAAANGHDAIISKLLEYNSSPSTTTAEVLNQQNNAGNTALHYAALNGRGGTIKLLLGAGADPFILNKAGKTARAEAESSAPTEETNEEGEGKWDIAGRLAMREDEIKGVKDENVAQDIAEQVDDLTVKDKAENPDPE